MITLDERFGIKITKTSTKLSFYLELCIVTIKPRYSKPSLQRQHLFPKDVAIKMNLLWYRYRILNELTDIKERSCFVLISPQNICFGYLLELPPYGNSNKYKKIYFIKVLNTIFLHNLRLTVTA